MPFGVVTRVSQEMGVLYGDGDRRMKGAVLGVNVGRPIEANGDFVEQLCESDALFPNYFGRTCFNK